MSFGQENPHNVVGEYIEHYSKKGDIVLDPFVGSGVTAIEALKRGRKAIAIDLDARAPLSKEKIDRIREIDVLWLKNGEIVYEFEVENTTGISDAIIRGSNIPSTTIKRFIIIPEERQKLLQMKIAEPILRESIEQYKWNFIFYDTFISFYEKNKQRKTIEPNEIDKLANLSTRTRQEQQTLGQFIK